MSSDVYGLEVAGTGGWDETVADRFMSLHRQVGTTTRVEQDRLFALRAFDLAKRWLLLSFPEPEVLVTLPASLEAKLDALSAEASEPGWDGERGLAVEASAWGTARAILRQLPRRIIESEALHVSMSGDGFVHVTVSLPERGSATVEAGHCKFYWTWMRGMDEDDTAELASLADAVEKLRTFIAG